MSRPSLRLLILYALAALLLPCSTAAATQSPDTSAVAILVVDAQDAVVPAADVTLTNSATGVSRHARTGSDGRVVFAAVPLTGRYTVAIERAGFAVDARGDIALRAGETAELRVTLVPAAASADVQVFGTADGVRADAQLGRRLDGATLEATPILGRKISSVPLLNAAFRQGKGTGDLFVNATFFMTASGSRRTTTFMLDGATNDEGWGRQTMQATVPLGAVQEMAVLSSAFSAEFGWTSGPAVNIVTRSGTNALHGEVLYLTRPGAWQTRAFATDGFCPPSVASCVTPATLTRILPADTPDVLHQGAASLGGPLRPNRTFVFAAGDYTAQNRTARLADTLPAFVLPSDGSLQYVGRYRQRLANLRVDERLSDAQSLMLRVNHDHFFDTNPNAAVSGTNAPTVARRYTRGAWTGQVNHTAAVGSALLVESRVALLNGDPVTRWEPQSLSTTYTRAGTVPFTIGESRAAALRSRQVQVSQTLTWSRGAHSMRLGGSAGRHTSGGTGTEPGLATLGTFTFLNTTAAPFSQLSLADVQQYTQPVSYGITSYELSQWLLVAYAQDRVRLRDDLTLDLGVRYDRQTLTDARANVVPRVGLGWHPGGDPRTAVRAGYGMYYTQVRANLAGGALLNGLDGLTTYTAVPGQTGFPTCLTGACLPVAIDPRTLPASQQPARNITIRAGQRDAYRAQFARYGLDFNQLPGYPDALVNPRSQVATAGIERELWRGLFLAADVVRQRWTQLDRTVDLNAPAPFDRTSPGQVRSQAVANATRPIVPVNGGVRAVNVLMNLGEADYTGLQTQLSFRGARRLTGSLSYTLSSATNTTEPDGNGIVPNDGHVSRLGEVERGPSVVDQRHRAVIALTALLPGSLTAGTVTQLASGRPLTAITGIDNNGDGINSDRPVVNGRVMPKSDFRGTATQDVSLFLEGGIRVGTRQLRLRVEAFNVFNHANLLGRAQTIYGDAGLPLPTFGQLVPVGTAPDALPALANIDPPRSVQVQARLIF